VREYRYSSRTLVVKPTHSWKDKSSSMSRGALIVLLCLHSFPASAALRGWNVTADDASREAQKQLEDWIITQPALLPAALQQALEEAKHEIPSAPLAQGVSERYFPPRTDGTRREVTELILPPYRPMGVRHEPQGLAFALLKTMPEEYSLSMLCIGAVLLSFSFGCQVVARWDEITRDPGELHGPPVLVLPARKMPQHAVKLTGLIRMRA
jgi:hypothetical protein